jgi:hypothetical protein
MFNFYLPEKVNQQNFWDSNFASQVISRARIGLGGAAVTLTSPDSKG